MGETVGRPRPEYSIPDEESLRRLFHPVTALATQKSLPFLDAHARAFIALSPFLCIGTQDEQGEADVSPRGDPPGFVTVIDQTTIAIPDRPGNNRLDSLANILSRPSVGLLFMIPGFDDTLRVNGIAALTTDPDLLAVMAVKGRVPTLAIVVTVTEAFLHCAKAFKRSHLWDATRFRDRGELPSLTRMILAQTGGTDDEEELRRQDVELEREYARTMY